MDLMEFLLQDSHITFAMWWGEVAFALVAGGFIGYFVGLKYEVRQPYKVEISTLPLWTYKSTPVSQTTVTPKEEPDGCNN